MQHDMTIPVFDTAIPPPGRYTPRKYPFAELKVGESLFMPGAKSNGKEYKAAQRVAHYRRWKIAIRTSPEGFRVWRLE